MSKAGLVVALPAISGWYAQCEMKPVSAITVIVGTSSVPRNDVSHGPRRGLRQNSGRNGPREDGLRVSPPTGARGGGDSVADTAHARTHVY